MDAAGSERELHEELPCIWVLSGVLNYHLCGRDYECEGCQLHHALSGEGRPTFHQTGGWQAGGLNLSDGTPFSGQARSHLSQLLAGCRLYLDRPYRPPHFWLSEGEDDVVTVGLDGYLLRLLRPIRRIVSPGPGLHLERDQSCGWIAREHQAVPLKMPIAGEVLETNGAYSESPEVSDLPERRDWLFRVRAAESLDDVTGIVRAEDTLSWYAARLRTVKQAILAAVAAPGLGPVLADGGAPQTSLEGVLGKQAFDDLIARVART